MGRALSERTGHLNLFQAIDDAVAGGGLLVAADFDGTLAPLVANPDEAVTNSRAMAALLELASRTGVTVAIVSGRRREDLESLVGHAPGVTLVGEHGNDYGDSSGPIDSQIGEIRSELEAVAATAPGSIVESKRHSVAFHHRNARRKDAASALQRIRAWAADRTGITITEGKMILELSVATRDKGNAVADLIDESGARSVLFLGDDTTDETVFAMLRPVDIGVKVGPGASAAKYRVKDIEAVAELLERVNDVF